MMTVADVIRSMSDLELAQFLYTIIDERDKVISESLVEQGIPNSLITMPTLAVAHHMSFLRRPAEEVFDLDLREEDGNENTY